MFMDFEPSDPGNRCVKGRKVQQMAKTSAQLLILEHPNKDNITVFAGLVLVRILWGS